ncbi:MAG: DUF6515 family protein [Pseudomonadota bacterium]
MNIKILGLAAILVGNFAPTAADAVNPVALQNLTTAAVISQVRPADRRDDRRQRRTEDRRREDRREDRRDDWREDRQEDRRDDRRDDRWERYWRYRIGVRLATLPLRHSRVVIGSTVYYYADGVYLVQRGGGYVVVGAPIGARIVGLPYGFRSFWIGPRRYFYVNSTYYVYAPGSRDYVVVAAPSGAEQAVANIAPEPVVYPAGGQSVEQIDQDRYECHRWAMGESDFDPTRSQQDAGADQDRYNRALSACLTGRGYTVG